MLTDLPQTKIDEVNNLLLGAGLNACVSTQEIGDETAQAARIIFDHARAEIDDLLAYLGISPTIYVCCIEASFENFQACAIRFNDAEYCIAIWLGVTFRTNVALHHLLATEAAADYFEIPVSQNREPPISGAIDTFSAFQELGIAAVKGRLPELAEKLRHEQRNSAFRWLVFHEIAHIINGHLEYGRTLNGLNYIIEDGRDDDLDENLTSQTLEMDADAYATMMSMQHRMIGLSVLEKEVGADETARRYDLTMKSYAFAIFAIIRGFDFHALSKDEIFASDHPPGGMRIQLICNLFYAMVELERFPTVDLNTAQCGIDAVEALENAISEATGIPSRGGNYAASFDLTWEEYHDRLLRRWAKLYPELNAKKLNPNKLALPQLEPA